MGLKDIESKIENIKEEPKETKESSIDNFKSAKEKIKELSSKLKYQIGTDFPTILRILDKGGYTKVAEFRPNNVTYYYNKTYKKRIINIAENEKLINYIKGNSSLKQG